MLEGIESSQTNTNGDDSKLPESFDHILPDNLFASPTKFAAEHRSVFSEASASTDDSIPVTITSSKNKTLSMASHKSCYVEIPRYFSSFITLINLERIQIYYSDGLSESLNSNREQST
ncbi:hypothetical protein C2S52_017849 [Perilla frutescens var. hirtella]|nr:hypothetical protein C2S52_017849 [Perilla frutescens var. hirtella]